MDPREWRNAMGKFATGVTVITGIASNGEPFGITANAFTSLSLEPNLLLICVDNKSSIAEGLRETKKFCVNILSGSQREISQRFAQKGLKDKFNTVPHRMGVHGTPVLDDCLASIECKVHNVVEGGDHYIFIGEGLEISLNEKEQLPLLFFSGQYKSVKEENIAVG